MKKLICLVVIFFFCVLKSFSAQSVTLAWDRHVSHTNLTSFILKWGFSSGNYTEHMNVATNFTTATVNNLIPDTTYYFVVTAKSAIGESDPSNEVSYHVPPSGTVVYIPDNFLISSIVTNNSTMVVTFSWNVPINHTVIIYALTKTNEIFSLTNMNVIPVGEFSNSSSGSISNLPTSLYRFKARSYSSTTGAFSPLTTNELSAIILDRPSTPIGFKISP